MSIRETTTNRRRKGAYYTRPDVAEILCGWAIRRDTDLVLEPSFGGCEFVSCASDKLSMLGSSQPLLNIFGSDIDKGAFDALEKRVLLSLQQIL